LTFALESPQKLILMTKLNNKLVLIFGNNQEKTLKLIQMLGVFLNFQLIFFYPSANTKNPCNKYPLRESSHCFTLNSKVSEEGRFCCCKVSPIAVQNVTHRGWTAIGELLNTKAPARNLGMQFKEVSPLGGERKKHELSL